LASGGVDLYNQIAQINVDSEASRRGIYHRHWIEQRAGILLLLLIAFLIIIFVIIIYC
jgi:succinate dehydrogenase hydrophobic anchor subunit